MSKSALLLVLLLPAAAATPIQPGRWETTVTIVDMKMPGAPPQVAAMLRGRPTKGSSCITPAQAAAGPRAAMERSNNRCRFTDYSMAGGRLRSSMVCAQPGGSMTFRSTGTYTPTSMTMEGVGTGTGGNAVTMRTRTVSRRLGPC